jgi:RNA polymerase sigma-70 factor (ECF subfamily)
MNSETIPRIAEPAAEERTTEVQTTDARTTDARKEVENLFRHEAGKLAASLSRAFGLSKLNIVEDLVQDALLSALRTWSFHGVPPNPTAWLHRVAQNKAIDLLRHRSRESSEPVELVPGFRGAAYSMEIEQFVMPWEIEDSMLRMMFACAHPGIPAEAQIALILKTLCGFSRREIANAFLQSEDAIEKRIWRAKNYFQKHQVSLERAVLALSSLQRRLQTFREFGTSR